MVIKNPGAPTPGFFFMMCILNNIIPFCAFIIARVCRKSKRSDKLFIRSCIQH